MNIKGFMSKKRWIAATAVLVMLLAGGTTIMANGNHEEDNEQFRMDKSRSSQMTTEREVIIGEIEIGSPADIVEFLPGDKILTVAGEPVTTNEVVETIIRRRTPNKSVTVTVQRGDKELSFEITPVKKFLDKDFVGWDLDGSDHDEK